MNEPLKIDPAVAFTHALDATQAGGPVGADEGRVAAAVAIDRAYAAGRIPVRIEVRVQVAPE